MRRLACLAALSMFVLLAPPCQAKPDEPFGARGERTANAVFRVEGDSTGRQPFAISCSSYAVAGSSLTSVVVADATSRAVLFQALSSNTGGICLSTSSVMSQPCSDSTPGYELAPGSSFTDYTTGAWYCSSRSGNTDKLKGARNTHTLDLGTQ